jgi:hypothetical protein
MGHPATLLQLLDRLNRKERFFLVGYALGNPRFQLSDEFRAALGQTLGLSIPMDALSFMDFHLDWLYAALMLHEAGPGKEVFDSPSFPRDPKSEKLPLKFNVNENPEDTDLLVAFDDEKEKVTHLILVEAKGVTGWSNRPIQSKGRRLRTIFGDQGDRFSTARPHFVIASPRPPQHLKHEGLPGFMLKGNPFLWMELRVPPHRIEIERHDETAGKLPKDRLHWRVKS